MSKNTTEIVPEMSTFDKIKARLAQSTKGTRMTILSDSALSGEVTKITTPTYDLNRILSGSLYTGIVSRTHTLLVGPEASGKSSFMCINLAEAQKLGYTPVIIDCEGAWTPEFCMRWGIDPTKAIIIPTMWIEEIMVELANIINDGYSKIALALDSIGAIESNKMLRDADKASDVKDDQGALQRKIKRVMKMIVDITKRQDSVSFSAGHYYGNPTGYGDPEKIGGGFYPKLAADYIVTLKKSPIYEFPNADKVKDRGETLGNRITAATIKNRFFPPFQEAVIEISYAEGVNRMAGLVDVALDMGLIEKGGAWFTVPCLDCKIQGEANLYTNLKARGEEGIKPLLDAIENILKTKGYSTVNTSLESLAEGVDDVSRDTVGEDTTPIEPTKKTSRKK